MQIACAALVSCRAAPPEVRTQAVSQPAVPREYSRSEFAAALAPRVDSLLRHSVADSAFPGAFAVIGDTGGVLVETSAGHLDWAPSPAPDRHTLWDLASLTKVIATTTLAAQLVERGAVDLDAPVQRYLPGWTGPGKEAVTVRHLLTHTSGLPSFRPYDRQTHDPDSLATLLFETDLERAPGARMVYSDIGAFVLGRVVEAVGGARLDTLARREIFEPLAMHETMFTPGAELVPRIAPTEIDTARGGLVRGMVHDERAYYLGGVAAHAGLFSSGADLARFAEMMLRGGSLDGRRVLAPHTVARFTAYADSATTNRALGWQKPEHEGMRDRFPSSSWEGSGMSSSAYGHTGFTGTSIAIDPKLGLYVILLTNRVNPTRNNPRISAVRRSLANLVKETAAQFSPTRTDGHR